MQTLAITLFFFFGGETNEEWLIDYDVQVQGPRMVYEGTALLHMTQTQPAPCMSYCFEVPEGYRLAGPVVSSDPGEPIIGFDWYDYTGKDLDVIWCRNASDLMHLPVSVPRHFKFYLLRTSFGPDDVIKLLADWGSDTSPWDLDLDGTVNGADLAVLLNGWSSDEGTA
jgi:hypothetical protein|tara:strand:- start:88 stop:591 length:504 start_codon:yes stop_codon:yes gene_type:complete